jgi:xylulokinase
MYLGLDLGTTNVKALLVDASGRSLAQGACPVPLHTSDGGAVEQDLDEIWNATLRALQQATAAVDSAAVRAIGVSSQGGAMQLLSRGGKPAGRVISWLDQRGQTQADRFTAKVGPDWLQRRIGQRRAWLSLGQLLRLRSEKADLLCSANSIGFVGDLIVQRLCGEAAHDGTSAGLTLLYNPARRTYDPDLLAELGITTSQLPRLLSPREPAGGLLPEIAAALKVPARIPVSAAIHDQYASALSAAVVEDGMVMVGTGTAWVVLAVTAELPQPATDSALICHHVVNDLYGQIVSLVNGGSAITWALELMGVARADSNEIERLLEAAPPASDGLCFWPFLTPFGASGFPGTRGRLSGLQLSHRPPHVLRAVVEGLGCELKRHLAMLQQAGVKLSRMVLTGGAAHGGMTPQILTDLTELPLVCCDPGAGSALGAAIVARGLLEPNRSLADLARLMTPPARELAPGPNAALYATVYQQYMQSLSQ